MTTETMNQQTAEELEAALLEGATTAPTEVFELIERYRELNKLEAPIKAEKEVIKDLIKAELAKEHVRAFTHNGVVAVELVMTHTKSLDVKGLEADEPELAKKYISVKDGTRIDFKK